MKKRLEIDNYYEGYRSSELNCIDLPIAIASGVYDRKNYFYYCFMYCLSMNFKLDYRKNWIENHKNILKSMGLEFVVLKVTKKNVISKIEKCINDGMPIIMIAKYGTLFYSRYYGWGTYNHGILIGDYDSELEIMGIRDREAIREHIDNGIFNSDVAHRLPVKYSHILEIWDQSNDEFKKEKLPYADKIFAIRKVETDDFSLKDELERMSHEKNMLEIYFVHLKQPYTFSDSDFEAVRRVFYRSFIPFFDVIQNNITDADKKNRLELIKTEFLESRMLVLNYIQRCILKNKVIENDKLKGDTECLSQLLVSLSEIVS